jgi:hypothetical protein
LDLNKQFSALAVTDSKSEVSPSASINSPTFARLYKPSSVQTTSSVNGINLSKESKMRPKPIMKLDALGGPANTPFANLSQFVLVLIVKVYNKIRYYFFSLMQIVFYLVTLPANLILMARRSCMLKEWILVTAIVIKLIWMNSNYWKNSEKVNLVQYKRCFTSPPT